MCEIICLIGLWKLLGNAAEEKGRPAIWFQLMGIGLWFGGEIVGAVVGVVFSGGSQLTAYMFALGGAVVGAGVSFLVVTVMPAAVPPPRYYPPMPPGR